DILPRLLLRPLVAAEPGGCLGGEVLEGDAGEELTREGTVVAQEPLAHEGALVTPALVVGRAGDEREPDVVAVVHRLRSLEVDDVGEAGTIPEDAALVEAEAGLG